MNRDNYKYLYATPDFFSVWALTHLKIGQLFRSYNTYQKMNRQN